MKIRLRILANKDAVDVLARDPAVASACDLTNVVFELDAADPIFERILELTRQTSGCWINPWMQFTAAELAACRWLQLESRKVLREGPRDYEINIATLRSVPVLATISGRIRLIDRISLHRARLKPNEIASAAEWMAEFVIHRGVKQVFEEAGLTGYSLRPLLNSATGMTYDDLFQLHTTHLMPAAEIDVTTPPHPDETDRRPRQLACLTYDFERAALPATDFNRTAEAWSSNDMPLWVVSFRVREAYTRAKLRGWAFRPVLERGTALHIVYSRTWDDLVGRIRESNPRHHF